jgi:hypothetical protein
VLHTGYPQHALVAYPCRSPRTSPSGGATDRGRTAGATAGVWTVTAWRVVAGRIRAQRHRTRRRSRSYGDAMGCGASSEANPVTPHPRGYQPKAPGHAPSSSPARATELDKSRRSSSSVLTSLLGVKECKAPVRHRSVDLQVRMRSSRRHSSDLHDSRAPSRRPANPTETPASILEVGGTERGRSSLCAES